MNKVRIQYPIFPEWFKWWDAHPKDSFNNFLDFKFEKSKFQWRIASNYYDEPYLGDDGHQYQRRILEFEFDDIDKALLFKLRFG